MTGCDECGGVIWETVRHVCPPPFRAWCVDEDEFGANPQTVRAHSPDDAAQRWAAEDDRHNGGGIAGGATVSVTVEGITGAWKGKRWRFQVTGEMVPEYHTKQIDPEVTP